MSRVKSLKSSVPAVGAVLAPLHEVWLQQVGSFLAAAREHDSDLGTSLAGGRWPGDQFGLHFLLECALVESLEGRLSPSRSARLASLRGALERTSEELRTAGRGGDRREAIALLARRFQRELAGWCVELELATAQLARSELPEPARHLLAGLEAASRWPSPVHRRPPDAPSLSA